MTSSNTYTAFKGTKLLCRGELPEVVAKIKRQNPDPNSLTLIFSDETGKTIDFNFQGSEDIIARRLALFVDQKSSKETGGRGRPKLGVVSREISLMPRHWEWLANQPSGASSVIRNLVETAMKKSSTMSAKQIQERAYRFMTTMAGDLEGYEEALRALYRKDKKEFTARIKDWPKDIRSYVEDLSDGSF